MKLNCMHFIALALILVIASQLAVSALRRPIYLDNDDPTTYHLMALKFAKGFGLDNTYFSPGYPVAAIAPLYFLLGPNESYAKLLNVFFLLGTLAAAFLIIKRLFPKKTDHLALFIILLLITLINPEVNYYYTTLYKEPFFVFLSSWIVLLCMENISEQKFGPKKLAIGIIAAFLTSIAMQSNAWILALFLFYIVAEAYFASSSKKGRASIIPYSLALAFFLFAFLAPWALLYLQTDEHISVMPTNAKALIYMTNAPTGCQGVRYSNFDMGVCNNTQAPVTEWAKSKGINYSALSPYMQQEAQFSYISGYILSHPQSLVGRAADFAYLWFTPNVEESQRTFGAGETDYTLGFLSFLSIFSLAGLFFAYRNRVFSRAWIFPPALLAVIFISYALTYYLMRYKLYFQLFDVILASYAIVNILQIPKWGKLRLPPSVQKIKSKTFNLGKWQLAALGIFALLAFSYFVYPYFQIRTDLSFTLFAQRLAAGNFLPIYLGQNNTQTSVFLLTGSRISKNCTVLELKEEPLAKTRLTFENYYSGYILEDENDFHRWAAHEADIQKVQNGGTINLTGIDYKGKIVGGLKTFALVPCERGQNISAP